MPWSTSSSTPCAPSNRMRLPLPRAVVEVAPDRLARTAARNRRSRRVGLQPLAVDRRLAEAGAERVVVRAEPVEQRVEIVELGEVADPDRAAADLVFIGRADAAAGGADLARARRILAQCVEVAVDRQDQRAGVGDHQHVWRDLDALLADALDLCLSAHGSSTTPLPMTDGVPRDDSARKQRQACRSCLRRRACARRCGRPGTAPPCPPGWRASRRSCPCLRRPTGRR